MAGRDTVDLARNAVAGDSRALEALWRMHRRWVAAILLAHRPRGEDLEDLLQEVALTLVRGIGELREPGHFRGWLRTIAVNVARGAGRSARTRVVVRRLETDEIPDSSGASSDNAESVLEAIQKLSPAYREVLVLRSVYGFSQRRIASELGLPETTIETRLARARKMLREELSRRGALPGSQTA